MSWTFFSFQTPHTPPSPHSDLISACFQLFAIFIFFLCQFGIASLYFSLIGRCFALLFFTMWVAVYFEDLSQIGLCHRLTVSRERARERRERKKENEMNTANFNWILAVMAASTTEQKNRIRIVKRIRALCVWHDYMNRMNMVWYGVDG